MGMSSRKKKKAPLSLILSDIDYFKSYNDYYGHQAGDYCLKQVAYALSLAVKRSVDLVCRYGGEEFAIIMPDTDLQAAIKVAEEIALSIKKLKIPHAQSQVSEYVTMSLGISSQIPTQELRAKSAIATADTCLYQAKKQGRDRFVIGYTN
jgi:two-component system, cell cycle response regulator